MLKQTKNIFQVHAQDYRESGYWPRPISIGTKACHLSNWQKPDPKWAGSTVSNWQDDHANAGIGLLLGSPFPDGEYRQFKVKPNDGSASFAVGELLCTNRLCVIPPTVQPTTEKPYRSVGESLLETPFTELSLIEA